MPFITLTEKEIAMLKGAIRRGDDNVHFQEFLKNLDAALNAGTGQIHITAATFDTIERYSSGVGKMSWHGILFAIFGRALPDAFGSNDSRCSLIDINATLSPPSTRNYRVV